MASSSDSTRAQQRLAGCGHVHVVAVGRLRPSWASALERECRELDDRTDLDRAARIEVRQGDDHTLIVRARLSDGRSAVRRADSPERLALALEALLLLPPAGQATAAQATETAPDGPTSATPGQVEATPTPASAAEEEPQVAPAHPSGAWLHVGLGASVIGHIAGVPTVVAGGFSAHATLRVWQLFVEVVPRWEAEQASLRMRLNDFEMNNLGIGLLGGLRAWDANEGAAEFGGGLLVLSETQSYRVEGEELAGTLIQTQLTFFVRLLWGQSDLRWNVMLDVALVPSRFAHPDYIRDVFPPLPKYAVGLGFGAHWESS